MFITEICHKFPQYFAFCWISLANIFIYRARIILFLLILKNFKFKQGALFKVLLSRIFVYVITIYYQSLSDIDTILRNIISEIEGIVFKY